MNCTVKISADRAECWVPTQNSRGLAGRAVRAVGHCRWRSARSTGTTSAAASAGAAARRTSCARPRHRQAVPRRAGQDGLVARRGHGARLLPADLAVQAGRRPRRQGRARRPARPRLRPVDQRLREPGAHRRRQGRSPAPGLHRQARRRAARLHRAEPADRVRHAQHPRAGRPLARRQHQPERRVHGMLHGRSRAGRRRRLARVPPRPHGQASQASRRPQRGGGQGPAGASRCQPACIAASRSSWATAATRRPSPRSR